MRFIHLLVLFCITSQLLAQDVVPVVDSVVDTRYREDQFYLGITFNLLTNKPSGIDQSGFSGGLHTGFIRDMPLNERRNIALGIGAGFSMNTYNQNLFVGETPEEETIFRVIDSRIRYDKNWFTTYLVEVPVQLRWRTSTASSYKFWRVYTGLQLGYIYAYKFNFEQTGNQVIQTDVPELDRYRLGLTFTFGYDKFNFHFLYTTNPFFHEDARLNNGQTVGLNSFKLGLMFYIL